MIITKSVNPQPIVGEYKPTTASKPSTKPVVDSYEIASKPNAFAQQNPSAAADARTAQLGAKLGAKETAAEAALEPQDVEIGQAQGATPLPGGATNIQAGLIALTGGTAARGYSQNLPTARPELSRAPVNVDLRDDVEKQLDKDLGESVVKDNFSPRSQRDVGEETKTKNTTEETKEVMEAAIEGATETIKLTVDVLHVVEGVHLAHAGVGAATLGGGLALVGAASLGYAGGTVLDSGITKVLGKPLGVWIYDKVNGEPTGKSKKVDDRLGGAPLSFGESAGKEAVDRWVKERTRVSELDKASNPVGDREVETSDVALKEVGAGLVLKSGPGHADRSGETATLRATDPVTRFKSNPAPSGQD